VVHACYRDGRPATGAVAGMVSFHRLLGTWSRDVDRYVVMSEFAKSLFAAGGLPSGKLAVKPNFAHPDPGPRDGPGTYVLFSGRLSEEKGLKVLLEAWKKLKPNARLEILGDGPLAGWLAQQVNGCPKIDCRGWLPREQALEAVKGACLLVAPSVCYEGSPLVVLEAFAAGVPVVASRIGSLAEIVEHGRTGLLATAGDPEDLAAMLDRVLASPSQAAAMGREARLEFETHYTAAANYEQLMRIYEAARRHA
jgi:glycosyltransferase involved in cell wall biosynthesis